MKLVIICCTVLLAMAHGLSQSNAQEIAKPSKVTVAPIIDGLLDDEAWTGLPRVSGFVTFAPDFGVKPVEQTEAAVTYDAENLYFAFWCREPVVDKIKYSVSSRDNIIPDDWVCINLDSFNDQQGLHAFYVNPLGIQADSKFAAGREDFSPDLVWYSAGRLDSSGYTVEVRLPLKSLRYTDTDPVVMGVIFERYISRRDEHSTYPELDPAKGFALLTQMKPLEFRGVEHYTLFELLPAVTFDQQYRRDAGEFKRTDQRSEFSLTTKYGISSDLIVDGTVNPDFSQVEADAGQVDVNLRYDLFYPEKRAFFLEGRDNFTMGATAMSDDAGIDPVRAIVHTRTIVDPLVGVKLTGKVWGPSNTIAAIYAMDDLRDFAVPGETRYAHFPVVRYKRSLPGDSYIGALVASREHGDAYNRIAGVDNQIRVSESSMLESSGFLSWNSASLLSASPASGHTIGLRYIGNSRNFDFSAAVREISEGFSADMGYVARTNLFSIAGLIRPRLYPSSAFFQRVEPDLYSAQTRDKFSGRWETYNHVSLTTFFAGNLMLRLRAYYATEVFNGESFLTGGSQMVFRGQFTKSFYGLLSYRRSGAVYYDSLAQGKSNRVTASMVFQPSDKLQSEVQYVFSDFTKDSDGGLVYKYPIGRLRLTYQLHRYVFVRGIGEYNDFRKDLLADVLASFTYIPGTVIHMGYGSYFEKDFVVDRLEETKRGLFFKTSYLWRM